MNHGNIFEHKFKTHDGAPNSAAFSHQPKNKLTEMDQVQNEEKSWKNKNA